MSANPLSAVSTIPVDFWGAWKLLWGKNEKGEDVLSAPAQQLKDALPNLLPAIQDERGRGRSWPEIYALLGPTSGVAQTLTHAIEHKKADLVINLLETQIQQGAELDGRQNMTLLRSALELRSSHRAKGDKVLGLVLQSLPVEQQKNALAMVSYSAPKWFAANPVSWAPLINTEAADFLLKAAAHNMPKDAEALFCLLPHAGLLMQLNFLKRWMWIKHKEEQSALKNIISEPIKKKEARQKKRQADISALDQALDVLLNKDDPLDLTPLNGSVDILIDTVLSNTSLILPRHIDLLARHIPEHKPTLAPARAMGFVAAVQNAFDTAPTKTDPVHQASRDFVLYSAPIWLVCETAAHLFGLVHTNHRQPPPLWHLMPPTRALSFATMFLDWCASHNQNINPVIRAELEKVVLTHSAHAPEASSAKPKKM